MNLRKRLAVRTRELTARGPEALEAIPSPEELTERSPADKQQVLEGLRVELFALSAMIAQATVQRALRDRPSYPPYGLARSKFSDLRMLVVFPEAYEEGSIRSFYDLWKAYMDTMVFHLYRQSREQLKSDDAWVLHRLGKLLALFRTVADPKRRERMRDGFSFIFGGLQFGTSVCVQLTEVMSRVLQTRPGMSATEKSAVIARSTGPAYRLAALNSAEVLSAYQRLLSLAVEESREGAQTPGWMDPQRFVVEEPRNNLWKISLRDREMGGEEQPAATPEGNSTYPTLGCPARISPTADPNAIVSLWRWTVELAHKTELLGPIEQEIGRQSLTASPPRDGLMRQRIGDDRGER